MQSNDLESLSQKLGDKNWKTRLEVYESLQQSLEADPDTHD